MEQLPRHSELPIGEKEFLKKRQEVILPAREVEASEHWANPAFEGKLPFGIERFNFFLTPDGAIAEGEKARGLMPSPEATGMGRSGVAHSIIFEDIDGNRYRDVNIKGCGGIKSVRDSVFSFEVLPITRDEVNGTESIGIMSLGQARADRDNAERFIREGIRTYRVIGILKLKEIIDETGQRVSIEDAKKRKLIAYDMEPAIELRALVTNERISYLKDLKSDNAEARERARLALRDAQALVSQELGRDKEMRSLQEYLEWFAKTLGSQVAKLKKAQFYHGALHAQNITLDCRIIDLGGVEYPIHELLQEIHETQYQRDYDSARYSLNDLVNYAGEFEKTSHYDTLFDDAYQDELKKPRQIRENEDVARNEGAGITFRSLARSALLRITGRKQK